MNSSVFAKFVRPVAIAAFAVLLALPSANAQGDSQPVGVEKTETAPAAEIPPPPALSPQQLAIQAELVARVEAASSDALKRRLAEIVAHYEANGFEPIWLAEGKPSGKAEELVEILNLSYEDGLHPADYDSFELFAKLGATGETDLADLEIHLSTAAVSYAQHMHSGRLNPSRVNREIVIYPEQIGAEVILENLRKTTSLKTYFRLLAPHTPRYQRLRTALADYRRIEAQGGWTIIPEGKTIKPDGSDERMPLVRKRMTEAGLYGGGTPADPLAYDPALMAAVAEFQLRSGLETDGVIGPATLAAMNVPVSDRINTMIVNMERNRWMQNDFGPYHILANLADQVVKVVKNGDTIHAEVIQVGQPYHRTPVFTDEMKYIEFNPYWNVPASIAVNEYLPKLRDNPGVLSAQNIDVLAGGAPISASAVAWSNYGKGNFPFRLRQRPGSGNALGRVKFMFPNQFNVYMHDTPSKSNFDRAQRYFSHGCLRLRDPLTMAQVLLAPQGISRERIEAIVASGKNTTIKLAEPIPVHVVYITSFVNKDGSVHFREDVYGRDKIVLEALEQVRGR
jgi:L,D-transpeptidase YcbB